MAYDTLFFDFVYEVIREKMILGTYEFSDSDVRVFSKISNSKMKKWPDGRTLHWYGLAGAIKQCYTRLG